ncbi:hypothetical protein [Flavobacterium gelatinilyticum]|uniref:hypothetical protein n=1 Tax=Flavobacterium gelatinilyticum TaxID=3003260 RepID=UPI00247FAF31|nr:hypothetical protein [Flavobacterium gelatinilyticum]
MDNTFSKYEIVTEEYKLLSPLGIEYKIIEYAEKLNLILYKNPFDRIHYEAFCKEHHCKMEIDYSIVFYARDKTDEDKLREQIEFQIQQLER